MKLDLIKWICKKLSKNLILIFGLCNLILAIEMINLFLNSILEKEIKKSINHVCFLKILFILSITLFNHHLERKNDLIQNSLFSSMNR